MLFVIICFTLLYYYDLNYILTLILKGYKDLPHQTDRARLELVSRIFMLTLHIGFAMIQSKALI